MIFIQRSQPAPPSLAIEKEKASEKYNKEDVVEALVRDFHKKCYICTLSPLSDIEVEHLVPHGNKDIDLKFDWNNLFLACPHCNNMKNRAEYAGKILDCCAVDPAQYLTFICQNDIVEAAPKNPSDEVSCMTAKLITQTFNNRNTGIRKQGCEARVSALREEMNSFFKALQKYQKAPTSVFYKRSLRGFLSDKSPFTAFKRDYIKGYLGEGFLSELLSSSTSAASFS